MSERPRTLRLEGLEPDNFLAFLALLGLLRALEEAERELDEKERWWPRASWDVDRPPWRPRLHLASPVERGELFERVERGIAAFREALDFRGRKMPDFAPNEYRALVEEAARDATGRLRLDVLGSVATDQVFDEGTTTPTPLCLMSGQGHQFFLERMAEVPFPGASTGASKPSNRNDELHDLKRALLDVWRRSDSASGYSFRWDPYETARQAFMAGDPTDPKFKLGTEKGANRLAAIGLTALPVVAEDGRWVSVPGAYAESGGIELVWPIWREPASLAAIRALLAHPRLSEPEALRHLGVVAVMRTRIERIGRFKNVGRAEAVPVSNQRVSRFGPRGDGRDPTRRREDIVAPE
ncbi:MAG: hypothetical protein NZ704_14680 [Geminicoccaceae bacterium]|nr:hypothetical protein [Geminicoccaceae bacterium]